MMPVCLGYLTCFSLIAYLRIVLFALVETSFYAVCIGVMINSWVLIVVVADVYFVLLVCAKLFIYLVGCWCCYCLD